MSDAFGMSSERVRGLTTSASAVGQSFRITDEKRDNGDVQLEVEMTNNASRIGFNSHQSTPENASRIGFNGHQSTPENERQKAKLNDIGSSGNLGLKHLCVSFFLFYVLIIASFCVALFITENDTKKLEFKGAQNPTMYLKDTNEAVRVASSDLVVDAGVLRERATKKAATTAAVQSFAFLPDLLGMPLEVIDSVDKLTFTTADGRVHGLPSLGFVLDKGDAGDVSTRTVTFFTPVPGTTVVVYADEAYLVAPAPADAPFGTPDPVKLRIILPEPDLVNRRRLNLLNDDTRDLAKRCARHDKLDMDVCLHTREEVLHLSGHFVCPETGNFIGKDVKGRRLESVGQIGVSYAELKTDAYSIKNNSGYISWAEAVKEQRSTSASSASNKNANGEKIEYDEFGCIKEDGYVTVGFPLTTKHCFRWQQTRDCNFAFASGQSSGYKLSLTAGLPEGFVGPGSIGTRPGPQRDWEMSCTASVETSRKGFCECGSGLKIKAGQCAPTGTVYPRDNFTCKDICLQNAKTLNKMSIDLNKRMEERYEEPLNLDSILRDNFFAVKQVNSKDENQGVTASVQDGVYFSSRLAFRRETPTHYGIEDLPSWIVNDANAHVAAHYTPDSLSPDGSVWNDVTGNERHAHVTLGKTTTGSLTKKTLRAKNGPEKATVVIESKTGAETVTFDHSLFPPSVTVLKQGSVFKTCSTIGHCKDVTNTVSAQFIGRLSGRINSKVGLKSITSTLLQEQVRDFQSWWAQPYFTKDTTPGSPAADLGTNFDVHKFKDAFSLPKRGEYEALCQATVVGDTECGETFDILYPPFVDFGLHIDAIITSFFKGLVEEPASLASGNEWTKCADGDGSDCLCNGGTIRYAPKSANAASLTADGFAFHTSTLEETTIPKISYWARSTSSKVRTEAGAEIVHYYKVPISPVESDAVIKCNSATLIPTAMANKYKTNADAMSASFTVSNWDCYCKNHQALNVEARRDLEFSTQMPDGTSVLRGDVFLFSDWETYKPFDQTEVLKGVRVSSMSDSRTVRDIIMPTRPAEFRTDNSALCIVNKKNVVHMLDRSTPSLCQSNKQSNGASQEVGVWYYPVVNPLRQFLDAFGVSPTTDGISGNYKRQTLSAKCRCKVGAKSTYFTSKNIVRKSADVTKICSQEHGHAVVPNSSSMNDDIFKVCGAGSILGVSPNDTSLKWNNYEPYVKPELRLNVVLTRPVFYYPSCKPACVRPPGESCSHYVGKVEYGPNYGRGKGAYDESKTCAKEYSLQNAIYKIGKFCYLAKSICENCLSKISIDGTVDGKVFDKSTYKDYFTQLTSCEYNANTADAFEKYGFAGSSTEPSCPASHPFSYAKGQYCCNSNKGYESLEVNQNHADYKGSCKGESIKCGTTTVAAPQYTSNCPTGFSYAFRNGSMCCNTYMDWKNRAKWKNLEYSGTDSECGYNEEHSRTACPSGVCAPFIFDTDSRCKNYEPNESLLTKTLFKEATKQITTYGFSDGNSFRLPSTVSIAGVKNLGASCWGHCKSGGQNYSGSCEGICGTGKCCRKGWNHDHPASGSDGNGDCYPTEGVFSGHYCITKKVEHPPATFTGVPQQLHFSYIWQSPIDSSIPSHTPRWYHGNGDYGQGLATSCTKFCQRVTRNAATKCLGAVHMKDNYHAYNYRGLLNFSADLGQGKTYDKTISNISLTKGWRRGTETTCDWMTSDLHKRCWVCDQMRSDGICERGNWQVCTQVSLKCLCQRPNTEPIHYKARIPEATDAQVYVIKKKIHNFPSCVKPGDKAENSCAQQTDIHAPTYRNDYKKLIPGRIYRINGGTEWETCIVALTESKSLYHWPEAMTHPDYAYTELGSKTCSSNQEKTRKDNWWRGVLDVSFEKKKPAYNPGNPSKGIKENNMTRALMQCQITPWENPFPKDFYALPACPDALSDSSCLRALESFCTPSQQAQGGRFYTADCDMDGKEDFICEGPNNFDVLRGSACQVDGTWNTPGLSWATQCKTRSSRFKSQPPEVLELYDNFINRQYYLMSDASLRREGFTPVDDLSSIKLNNEDVNVYSKFVSCTSTNTNSPDGSHCDISLPKTSAPPSTFNVVVKLLGDAAGADEDAAEVSISAIVDRTVWVLGNDGSQTCDDFCLLSGQNKFMKNTGCAQARLAENQQSFTCADAHGTSLGGGKYKADKIFDCLCERAMRSSTATLGHSGPLRWNRDIMKEGAKCFNTSTDVSETTEVDLVNGVYTLKQKESLLDCKFSSIPASLTLSEKGYATLFRGPKHVPEGTEISFSAPPGTTFTVSVLAQSTWDINHYFYGKEKKSNMDMSMKPNSFPRSGWFCPSDKCGACTGNGVQLEGSHIINNGKGFASHGEICCDASPVYITKCPDGYTPYNNGANCCPKTKTPDGKKIYYDTPYDSCVPPAERGSIKACFGNAHFYKCAPTDVTKTMLADNVKQCFEKCPVGTTSAGGGSDWGSCFAVPFCPESHPTYTVPSGIYKTESDFCTNTSSLVKLPKPESLLPTPDKYNVTFSKAKCPIHCVRGTNKCVDPENPTKACTLPPGFTLAQVREVKHFARLLDGKVATVEGNIGGSSVSHKWKYNGEVYAQVGRQTSTTHDVKGVPMKIFSLTINCSSDSNIECKVTLPKTTAVESLAFVGQSHKFGTLSSTVFQADKKWAMRKTLPKDTTSKACCLGYDVSSTTHQAMTLGIGDVTTAVVKKENKVAIASASIYHLDDADNASKGTRRGKYSTLFHIARYGSEDSNSQKKIFQNLNAANWFDGFDSGKSGVANHFDDFVTEMVDRHPFYTKPGTEHGNMAWVLSSSTTFGYRSNFVTRPLVANRRTARSLAGIQLVINPDGVTSGSPFQIAEIMVLHTDFPLTESQIEDVERFLFRKNLPLFLRAQYTVDGFQEDTSGSSIGKQAAHSGLWHSTSIASTKETATVAPVKSLTLSDNGQGGKTIESSNEGATLTFPSYTIPTLSSGGEFTTIAIAKFPQLKPLFSVEGDDKVTACLRSGAASRGKEDINASQWDARLCETRPRPVLKLIASSDASEKSKSLIICEVEIYSSEIGEGKTNIALNRPSSLSSTANAGTSSKLGNDGVNSTCAESQANGIRTWEVELDPGIVRITKVIVRTTSKLTDPDTSATFTVELDGTILGHVVPKYALNPTQSVQYKAVCPNGTFVFSNGSHCCKTDLGQSGSQIRYASSDSECKSTDIIPCPAGEVDDSCAPSASEPEIVMKYGKVSSGGTYTFAMPAGPAGANRFSVWLLGSKKMSVCEIEIYAAPSTITTNNPNVALLAPVAVSPLLAGSASSPALVDGDPNTCITTDEIQKGIIRIDLSPGVVPMRVVVKGIPSGPSVNCQSQKASIDGAQLYVGTRSNWISKISSPLIHACDETLTNGRTPHFIRHSLQDLEENFLELHPIDVNVSVCEISAYAKDQFDVEYKLDLASRPIYFGNKITDNATEALRAVDGNLDCGGSAGAAALNGKVLRVGIPHGVVISRVDVRVTNSVVATGSTLILSPSMTKLGILGASSSSSTGSRRRLVRTSRRLSEGAGICTPGESCGWCQSAGWGGWKKNDFKTNECLLCNIYGGTPNTDCPTGKGCWSSVYCTASSKCGTGTKCQHNNHGTLNKKKDEVPLTCGDTNKDGVDGDNFDCSAETLALRAKPEEKQCADSSKCTATECCTVIRKTCLDPKGNGSKIHPMDCSGHALNLHAKPESIRCGSKCTQDLCCTVAPPKRTCADRNADGSADGSDFVCSAPKLLDSNPASVECTENPLKCTASDCCTRFQRTCDDPGATGSSSTFSCSGDAKDIDANPKSINCPQNGTCTAALCCTITPIARTCADRNALGAKFATPFDCSLQDNALSATPAAIQCAGNPCTSTECCTTIRKTCANINASKEAPVAFDCKSDPTPKSLDGQPERIQCTNGTCTAATCCTVDPSGNRTCNDIDGDGTPTPYSCEKHPKALHQNAKDMKCSDNGAGPCNASLCCTVTRRTCNNTDAKEGEIKKFDCSKEPLLDLGNKPEELYCTGSSCTSQECCIKPRKVDCVGKYGDYGPCSKSCGGGTQTKAYVITTPAANGGTKCGTHFPQKQACNTQTCPVNCVGQWSDWSKCSKDCVGGTQTRSYTILRNAEHGGAVCDQSAGTTQPCNSKVQCPTGIIVSESTTAVLNKYSVFIKNHVSDEANYNASIIGSGANAGKITICGMGGPKIAAAAGGSGVGSGQHYKLFVMSSPCKCEALCSSELKCQAWGFDRNPRSANYKSCYLSKVEPSLREEISLDYIGGSRPTNQKVSSSTKTLSATFSSGASIAEMSVLDVLLPPQTSEALLDHIKRQYAQLMKGTTNLSPPMVTLNNGFMVQAQSVKWAIGPSATWKQTDENFVNLTTEEREAFGLSPLAHSITAKNSKASYVTSKDMVGSCLAEVSKSQSVTTWAFDPVSTSAFDKANGKERSLDSYGVEVESLAICRRMTTAEAVLSSLPKSTVCGMTHHNGPNPTCQPTVLKATWTGGGVSFAFKPGCRAATQYQFVRDRNEQIGSDFNKVFDKQRTPVQSYAHKTFCNTFIQAGMSHQDFGQDIMLSTGLKVEYCIRSVIPGDAVIVTSDWTCTSITMGWKSSMEIFIMSQGGSQPQSGVLINSVLCTTNEVECNASVLGAALTKNAWQHSLGDGGSMVSFTALATSKTLVPYKKDNSLSKACKYVKDTIVNYKTDKPDFEMILDHTDGIAWYAEAPGCFLHVGERTSTQFKVIRTGGVQSEYGFLGFGYHFRVERLPSWHFMARHCRDTCGLTGSQKITENDVYRSPFVGDVATPQFCFKYKARCPDETTFEFAGGMSGESRGAFIFGQDMIKKDMKIEDQKVECDPHVAKFAYFDKKILDKNGDLLSGTDTIQCCEGFRPSQWDSCMRVFTKCDKTSLDAVPVAPPSSGAQKREFNIFLETAQALHDKDQLRLPGNDSALPWLNFKFGSEKNTDASILLLVDAEKAAMSIPTQSPPRAEREKSDIQIINAWSGLIRQYSSVRLGEEGAVEIPFSDVRPGDTGANSNIRRIHIMPTRVSMFPSPDSKYVVTYKHNFVSEKGTYGMDAVPTSISKILEHQILSDMKIVDTTVVTVPVKVVHPDVGIGSSPSSCGVENILMCAFTADNSLLGCGVTDKSGEVGLSIPRGMNVKIRNGCPKEASDYVMECDSESKEIIKGLDILNDNSRVKRVGSEYGDGSGRFGSVSAAVASAGSEIIFIEVASRHPIIRLAAGRFIKHNGGPNMTEAEENAQFATTFSLHTEIRQKISFKLTFTGPGTTHQGFAGGCDRVIPLANTRTQKHGGREYSVRLPRDLPYEISVLVDDMESWPATLFKLGNGTKTFSKNDIVSQKTATLSGLQKQAYPKGTVFSQDSGATGLVAGVLVRVKGLASSNPPFAFALGSSVTQATSKASAILIKYSSENNDAILLVTGDKEVVAGSSGGKLTVNSNGVEYDAGVPTFVEHHTGGSTKPDIVVSVTSGEFAKIPVTMIDDKDNAESLGIPSNVVNTSGEGTVFRQNPNDKTNVAIIVTKGTFTNMGTIAINKVDIGIPGDVQGEPQFTKGQAGVAKYLRELPAIPVDAKDTDPEMSFMFRKKATLKLVLNSSGETSSLRSCLRMDSSPLYGVTMVKKRAYNEVVATIAAHEAYATSDNGSEVMDLPGGDLPKLLYVPGKIDTNDNLAYSKDSRFVVSSSILVYGSDGQPKNAGYIRTKCKKSTGCTAENILTHACGVVGTTPEEAGVVTKPALCDISGETLEGTFYQLYFDQLSSPERYDPFTKQLEYTFTPSKDDLPSAKAVRNLTTKTWTADIVVEGEVDLTRNQSIKLPEYVPFTIIRDPPGDDSFAVWRKDTTLSVGVTVGFTKASQKGHTSDWGAGAAVSFRKEIAGDAEPVAGGFGGIGMLAGMEINVVDTRMVGGYRNLDDNNGGLASDAFRQMQSTMEVHMTASAEYSTSAEAGGGAFQDLIVLPSLAIITKTALPILFRDDNVFCKGDATCVGKPNAQCAGYSANEISTWSLINGGDDEALKTKLDDFHVDSDLVANSDIMGANLTSLKLRNYAVQAIKDDTWNAVTVHTVYDVIKTRIPQLQARCFEEWNDLRCNYADVAGVDLSKHVTSIAYSGPFGNGDTTYCYNNNASGNPDPSKGKRQCPASKYFDSLLATYKHVDSTTGRNWCNLPLCSGSPKDKTCGLTGTVKNTSCDNIVKKTYTSAEKTALKPAKDAVKAQARLLATLDAIKGWIRVLKLNEELKANSTPVQSSALVASSLLQGEQGFSANPDIPGFYAGADKALNDSSNGMLGSTLSNQLGKETINGVERDYNLDIMFSGRECIGHTDRATCTAAGPKCYWQRYCAKNCNGTRADKTTSEVTDNSPILTKEGQKKTDLKWAKQKKKKASGMPYYQHKCSVTNKFNPKSERVENMVQDDNTLSSPKYVNDKQNAFRGGSIGNMDPATTGSSSIGIGNIHGASGKSTASLVAFSGGGSAAKYSYTSSQSSSLVLNFEHTEKQISNSYASGYWNIFVLNVESNGEWYDEWQNIIDNSQDNTRVEERAVEFTLSDSSIGDYFDVEVLRDKVYGTPVFRTKAGRSMCPHEAGTDPREQFDVQFQPGLNNLDLTGPTVSKKARNVERGNGATTGDCASFYLDLINETPYADDLELVLDLIPPENRSKYGDYDTTGLSLESKIMTTFGTQDMPLLLDDQKRTVRFDICPTGDERDFEVREKRFKGKCSDKTKLSEVACTGNWDHDADVNTDEVPRVWTASIKDETGVDHSGFLYCNVKVRISSKCEDQIGNWSAIPKGYEWDQSSMGTNLCSSYNPVKKRTFPKSVGCWNKELTNVLDGSTEARGLEFASELPLRREVLIPCLSFHKTKNLCEQNRCEGM